MKQSPNHTIEDSRLQAEHDGMHLGKGVGFWLDLGRWLMIVPMVMLALLLTSNLALAVEFILDPVSSKSSLVASYAPWESVAILSVSKRIVIDMIQDDALHAMGSLHGSSRYQPPSDETDVFLPTGSGSSSMKETDTPEDPEATQPPSAEATASPTIGVTSTPNPTTTPLTSTPTDSPAASTRTASPTEPGEAASPTPTSTQLPTASQTQAASWTPNSATPTATQSPDASSTPTATDPVTNPPDCGQLRIYDNILDGDRYLVEVNNRNAQWPAFLVQVTLQWENDDGDLDKMDWGGWNFWDGPGVLNDKSVRTINNWSVDPELAPGMYEYWSGIFTPGPLDLPGTWYELRLTFEFRTGQQTVECTVAASH